MIRTERKTILIITIETGPAGKPILTNAETINRVIEINLVNVSPFDGRNLNAQDAIKKFIFEERIARPLGLVLSISPN